MRGLKAVLIDDARRELDQNARTAYVGRVLHDMVDLWCKDDYSFPLFTDFWDDVHRKQVDHSGETAESIIQSIYDQL